MLSPITAKRFLMLGLIALLSVPAYAHHSTAMFDKSRTVELEGTIVEFQWTNPHTWIEIDVLLEDGQLFQYSIEGGAVRTMEQQGWKIGSLKPGDQVKLVVYPMRKKGRVGGMIVSATTEDGRVLTYQPR